MEFKKIFKISVLFLILSGIFLFAYVGNPTRVALATGDTYNLNFPLLSYNSGFKLWNPYVQMGKNSVLDLQGQATYPLILIISVFKNKVVGFNLFYLIQVSLAGIFMYLFLKSLKRSDLAAILGGLVLIFGGFYSGHRGHVSMLSVMMWLPLILFFVNKFFERDNKKYLFYAALGIGLSILAGDPAFVLYSSMIIIPFIVFSIFNNKKPFWKTALLIFSTIYVLGILLASVLIIPGVSSFGVLSRAKNFWANFSSQAFNPVQILSFVFPAALQGLNYWGGWSEAFSTAAPVWESMVYFGLMPFLLYLASFFYKFKNKYINFWKFLSLFFLLLMFGSFTPLCRFIYNWVPFLSLFSIPSRYNGSFLFCAAVVFGYVLDEYKTRIVNFRSFVEYFSLPFFSFLILLLAAGSFMEGFFKRVFVKILKILFLRNADLEIFKSFKINNNALIIPSIIIIGFLGVFCLYFLQTKKGVKRIFAGLLIAFIFIDIFSFNSFNGKDGDLKLALEDKNFSELAGVNKDITAGNFRIFSVENTPWPKIPGQPLVPDLNTIYKVPSLGGYGPVIYKDFSIDTNLDTSGNFFYGYESMLANPEILGKEYAVKYVYTSDLAVKKFLDNFKFKAYSYKKMGTVYSFDGNKEGLTLINSEFKGKEIALTGDPTISKYSIAQAKVKLEKNCDYLISLEAYSREPGKINEWLFSDIVDNKPYSVEKTLDLYPFELSAKPTIYSRIINTGDLGENPVFRVVTASSGTIFIKNFSLTKVTKVYKKEEQEIAPYLPVLQREGFYIYENVLAEGRGSIYSNAKIYKGIETYKNLLYEQNKDYNSLYFQESDSPEVLKGEGFGTILKAEYGENKVVFEVKNEGQIFFELKDYYDKDWKCYVDGKATPIYQVNGIFRGIIIKDSGTHTIVFKYVPVTFYIGLTITILSLLFILFFGVKDEKNKKLLKINKN